MASYRYAIVYFFFDIFHSKKNTHRFVHLNDYSFDGD